MKGVTVTRKVSLTLTAGEWMLYTSMSGVDIIADTMNTELEYAISNANNIHDASLASAKILSKYSEYGATDTEPRYVMLDILNEVFK